MSKGSALLSLLSSIGASLCCITPLLTLISGVSGMASYVTWVEPARPYLIGLTVSLLAVAWYQKLRPRQKEDCGCEVPKKSPFLQSALFLGLMTMFTVLFLSFPLYARIFYRAPKAAVISAAQQTGSIKQVEFFVKGMGCADCEPEVEAAVSKLSGVYYVKASCKKKNAVVAYDSTLTNTEAIRQAINSTGYTVQSIKQ